MNIKSFCFSRVVNINVKIKGTGREKERFYNADKKDLNFYHL